MTSHAVTILDTGETFTCSEGESLLAGMERLGRRGIPVGCRGGGCGVCKVEILEGTWTARKMSRDHVSEDDQANGRVLACRTRPTSDVGLRVLGAMRRSLLRGAPAGAAW